MNATAKSRFTALEAGRGFAAGVVVLHHAGSIGAEPRFWGRQPFGGLFVNFNVGIDFFFVLSGFIIAWIHWKDLGNPDKLGNYARKRFLRIFPPYWGVLIPLAALYIAFPHAGDPSQHSPKNIVLSFFLLPNPVEPVLGVAWTLTYEIFFYALFAAAIVCGRRFLLLLPIWALAILIAGFGPPMSFPTVFLLNPANLEFIAGVGAAGLLHRYRIPAPGLVASMGIVLFLGLMLGTRHMQDNFLVGRLVFSVPTLMFVLGTVELERRESLRLPRWVTLLGAASYAIYLVHPVALSFAMQGGMRIGAREIPVEVASLLFAAIAIGIGVFYHFTGERWLVAFARHLMIGRKRRDDAGDEPRPVRSYEL